MKIYQRIKNYILKNQTYNLKNAPGYLKVLGLIYQMMGRKLVAGMLVATGECNSCQDCLQKCPYQAFELKFNTPRRTNKCNGCLLCVPACPNLAFVMPISSVVGTILLLFLPYDQYILNLLNYPFPHVSWLINNLMSLLLWSIGYVIAIFIFRKISFLVFTIPFIKKGNAYSPPTEVVSDDSPSAYISDHVTSPLQKQVKKIFI